MTKPETKEKKRRMKGEAGPLSRKADQQEQAERRSWALSCHFQKRTLLETKAILSEKGFDVSIAQINRDIQSERKRVLSETNQSNQDALFGRIAELDNLKRSAWDKKDLWLVLNIITQECKLLGLETLKIDMTTRKVENMDRQQMDEIMDRLAQAVEVPFRDASED